MIIGRSIMVGVDYKTDYCDKSLLEDEALRQVLIAGRGTAMSVDYRTARRSKS